MINGELIVDNFAGGGGASTGIEEATGYCVDIAINHDPEAIKMHKANHPYTKHYCEDVWQVDPVKVCGGHPVALAWFSPDCKHFSKAKGGQSSKATPTGAVAQFAAGGKDVKKKDLASIAMSYGYVYVAQISMGADYAQTVKAIAEAEAYPGPSLVIAYAPCINHGIKKGMDKAQTEEKLAVECGYWHNFRYNPAAEDKKFTLDSKAPTGDYQAFLKGEVRYASLALKNPDRAGALDAKNEEEAKARYQYLNKLVTLYTNN